MAGTILQQPEGWLLGTVEVILEWGGSGGIGMRNERLGGTVVNITEKSVLITSGNVMRGLSRKHQP